MMLEESLDIKVFTNTEPIGTKNAVQNSNLKLSGFLGLFGKNIFAMRNFPFTARG